jgi:predicted ArsR family transcriptional regulator
VVNRERGHSLRPTTSARPPIVSGPGATVSPAGALDDTAALEAMVAAVSSAFGDPTRRAIYRRVRSEPATASEIAAAFDLHPNVARHHLDKLTAGGYLEASLERPGGGVGRPTKRYRAVPTIESLSPGSPSVLLARLAVRALARLAPSDAEALAEEVGAEHGRLLAAQLAPVEGSRSLRSALLAVADALTAHGYAARAELGDGQRFRLVAGNCPFGEVASEHPVLCALEAGLVRGMLAGLSGGDRRVLASSRARGDPICAAQV